jgi:uncharacterized membrane protein YraQ (UPF0718 family)
MLGVGQEIIRILNESSVYLLLGFTLAGLLHVLMQRFPRVTGTLTGKGKRPVFLASLIGLPMPLCSCGVLPAALALRKNGASKGATASFLVSVPETDIVSILLTLALMGPLMAIFRPAAALVTAGSPRAGVATTTATTMRSRALSRATARKNRPRRAPNKNAAGSHERSILGSSRSLTT